GDAAQAGRHARLGEREPGRQELEGRDRKSEVAGHSRPRSSCIMRKPRGERASRLTADLLICLLPVKLSLMITCLLDCIRPDAGKAVVRTLRRLGHEIEFPQGQT